MERSVLVTAQTEKSDCCCVSRFQDHVSGDQVTDLAFLRFHFRFLFCCLQSFLFFHFLGSFFFSSGEISCFFMLLGGLYLVVG